ncbi:MAG TPA: energy transducer TonB [Candidatus Baltobacteraceae bacterium]|nr:energy transducer TonB [Candidatus Baltobacteraceae bacterium]
MIPRLFLFGVILIASLATRANACARPDREPQALYTPPLAYPASALAEHVGTRMVLVEVVIDSTGELKNAKILRTSGNAAIDMSALLAARQSNFAAAIANCVPVAREAVMRFVFNAPAGTVGARPTFSPPAGWTERPIGGGFANGPYLPFGIWLRRGDMLMLSGGESSDTLSSLKIVQTLTGARAKILENGIVEICRRTQKAALVTFTRNAPDPQQGYWAVLIVPDQGTEYVAAYYSPAGDPPDPAVIDAMKSTCVPQ